MARKYKNREDEVLKAYVRLVEAMFVGVYDRIRIKKSWHGKKISQRMLSKKQADLADLGVWLHSEDCRTWFDILGLCTGMGSRKMNETFLRVHSESMEFISAHLKKRAVDK